MSSWEEAPIKAKRLLMLVNDGKVLGETMLGSFEHRYGEAYLAVGNIPEAEDEIFHSVNIYVQTLTAASHYITTTFPPEGDVVCDPFLLWTLSVLRGCFNEWASFDWIEVTELPATTGARCVVRVQPLDLDQKSN